MQNYSYPTKLLGYYEDITVERLERLLDSYLVIAEVKLSTNKNYFPYRTNKLLFPIGIFTTTLATPELKLALEENAVVRVNKVAIYNGERLFTDYVNAFYNLKKTAKEKNDKFSYLMAKLFLNSLYGKFGQKVREYVKTEEQIPDIYGYVEIISHETGQKTKGFSLGNDFFEFGKESLSFNSFPAIASHVTSYARLTLLNYIRAVRKGKVYYCDTDSLFVNATGVKELEPFISDTELGKLKVEKILTDLVIYGAKDYEASEVTKVKGVPKNSQKIAENVYSYEQFLKTKSLLHYHVKGKIAIRTVVKKVERIYDKGVVTYNGFVEPVKIWTP
jgi:hypothetical protein